MRYLSVLVAADSEMCLAVKQVLEELGFDVLVRANAREAKSLVERYLPHLVVFEHPLAVPAEELSASASLMAQGHASPRLVALAREISAAEIESLRALGIADCLLFPVTYPMLYRRFKRMQISLARTPAYWFENFGDAALTGRLEFDGRVIGICETGIAVACDATTAGPVPEAACVSDIFDRIGVPVPRLRLLETRPKSAAIEGEEPSVGYFQVSGWNEDARLRLRRWEKDQRLQPQVLENGGSAWKRQNC